MLQHLDVLWDSFLFHLQETKMTLNPSHLVIMQIETFRKKYNLNKF